MKKMDSGVWRRNKELEMIKLYDSTPTLQTLQWQGESFVRLGSDTWVGIPKPLQPEISFASSREARFLSLFDLRRDIVGTMSWLGNAISTVLCKEKRCRGKGFLSKNSKFGD